MVHCEDEDRFIEQLICIDESTVSYSNKPQHFLYKIVHCKCQYFEYLFFFYIFSKKINKIDRYG